MREFLQLKHICCGYEKNLVIEDFSFSIEKGTFLGIIGPNGAGKTTLLKTINHIIPAQKGSVCLQGLEIKDLTRKDIARRISMVGQDIQLSFSLNVLDLVLMGRISHLKHFKKETKADLEIARDSLAATETLTLAERSFNQLSAGERQRVVLAKALAQQPQLLLLDEPTAHLDIGHQIKIFDLLLKLNQKSGLTIIAVLHDLNLAAEYCQELILLDKGKIVASGQSHEVLEYKIIEKTYGTVILVKENPLTKKPFIIPIPGKYTGLN